MDYTPHGEAKFLLVTTSNPWYNPV